MEDRILINGVWYIKEKENTENNNPIEPYKKLKEEDVHFTWLISWETPNWYFVAEKFPCKNSFAASPWITITDKREEKKGEEDIEKIYIDNPIWMIGIYEGNSESLEEAKKDMDDEGISKLFSFIEYLIDKKWIKYE